MAKRGAWRRAFCHDRHGWRVKFCCLWPIPSARSAFVLSRPEGRRNMSKTTTSSKTLRPMTMTPAAVEAAVRADRDAQPLSVRDLKRMKRTLQPKVIRRALALTQEEFAVRYHTPRHSPRLGARPRPARPADPSLFEDHCVRATASRAAFESQDALTTQPKSRK
jgi:DNA-binding transcriptional regulator YiaG